MTKLQKMSNWIYLWGSRLGLAVLAVAGMLSLLSGVSFIISVPFTIVLVALLLRETI